ncbi:hypothetical protein CAPI_02195 [Corynebacterium capitovis DSM 44611]|uniref:hypothetical protein n=1 Tax=Corynebacterium capitovis TaxID=131081 RepID=UPI00039D4463|nr:hypothetical protein [Corynebacterium capitovis]WKD57013.1 hypothetical protein CAPI_02195 [Corynebacterium capitovis DSM 44611]
MSGLRLSEGEVVLADTCSPLSGLVFPLLELIVITGVCWIAIGWMDAHAVDPLFRNAVVLLWAVFGVARFAVPVVSSRRRRFMVTDQRVLARGARGSVESIPLRQIHSARRNGGGLSLAVYGYDRPLYYPEVGKVKRVERLLNSKLGPRD